MTTERRAFGLMRDYDPGGYIGLLREFPDAGRFIVAVGDYEYEPELLAPLRLVPVWLAWRVYRDDDYNHPAGGFLIVPPGSRGATPGWAWGAYVPKGWER